MSQAGVPETVPIFRWFWVVIDGAGCAREPRLLSRRCWKWGWMWAWQGKSRPLVSGRDFNRAAGQFGGWERKRT